MCCIPRAKTSLTARGLEIVAINAAEVNPVEAAVLGGRFVLIAAGDSGRYNGRDCRWGQRPLQSVRDAAAKSPINEADFFPVARGAICE